MLISLKVFYVGAGCARPPVAGNAQSLPLREKVADENTGPCDCARPCNSAQSSLRYRFGRNSPTRYDAMILRRGPCASSEARKRKVRQIVECGRMSIAPVFRYLEI